MTWPSRKVDDRGAVAVFVAAVALSLFVLAAFAVDFGAAYNAKRQLQTASDAGALAAVQVYKGNTGSCATLAANATLKNSAQTAADSLAQANYPGATTGTIAVSCTGNALTVSYTASSATKTVFGGLTGVSAVPVGRTAAATIGDATQTIGNMRPWGICSNVATTSGSVVFAPLKGGATMQDGTGVCGTEGPPGGWWVMQCTGQSNANGTTEAIVTSGCPTNGYSAVPGQPSPATAQQLFDFLVGKCPSKTANNNCVQSDPGNNFHNASDEWQALVGKLFTMPGFCVKPQCSQLAVDGGGNNASYAIHQLLTVELCGFKIGGQQSSNWPVTGPCATSNPKNYTPSSVTAGDGFFVVVRGINGGGVNWTLNSYTDMRLTY